MTKRPLTPTVLQGVKEGLIVKNCNAPSGRHAFGCRVRARLTARQRPGLRPPKLLIVDGAHLAPTQELFLQPTKQKRMLRSPWHPFSWKGCDDYFARLIIWEGRTICFCVFLKRRHSSFFHDERRPQFSGTKLFVKSSLVEQLRIWCSLQLSREFVKHVVVHCHSASIARVGT